MKVCHLQVLPIGLEHLVALVVAINGTFQPEAQPEQVRPTKDLQAGKQVLMFPAVAVVLVQLVQMLFPQQVVEQVVRAFTPTLLVPLFNGVVVVVELLLILEPEVLVEQAVVGLVVALPLRQQQVHLVLHLLVAAGEVQEVVFLDQAALES
jgi:hypothetical protein